ncbi:MAG TPA: hypothetical protein VJO15_03030, partial [Dehalococcoidia bacterium]|nr:hypothetical protein [Dehalococcoidia bacterium]
IAGPFKGREQGQKAPPIQVQRIAGPFKGRERGSKAPPIRRLKRKSEERLDAGGNGRWPACRS